MCAWSNQNCNRAPSRQLVIAHLAIRWHLQVFFSSNAALLKTVAVMSLQTLGQKEADNYSPKQQKQNQNKPQPKQHTQRTKPGSGCGKRDVKRVVRNDVRQPANSLFKSPHTLRCSPPENTIAKIINPDQAQLSTNNSLLRAPFIIIEKKAPSF